MSRGTEKGEREGGYHWGEVLSSSVAAAGGEEGEGDEREESESAEPADALGDCLGDCIGGCRVFAGAAFLLVSRRHVRLAPLHGVAVGGVFAAAERLARALDDLAADRVVRRAVLCGAARLGGRLAVEHVAAVRGQVAALFVLHGLGFFIGPALHGLHAVSFAGEALDGVVAVVAVADAGRLPCIFGASGRRAFSSCVAALEACRVVLGLGGYAAVECGAFDALRGVVRAVVAFEASFRVVDGDEEKGAGDEGSLEVQHIVLSSLRP